MIISSQARRSQLLLLSITLTVLIPHASMAQEVVPNEHRTTVGSDGSITRREGSAVVTTTTPAAQIMRTRVAPRSRVHYEYENSLPPNLPAHLPTTMVRGVTGGVHYEAGHDASGAEISGGDASVDARIHYAHRDARALDVLNGTLSATLGGNNRDVMGGIRGNFRATTFRTRWDRGCSFALGTTGSSQISAEVNSTRSNRFTFAGGIEPALVCAASNNVHIATGLLVEGQGGVMRNGRFSYGGNGALRMDAQLGENMLLGFEAGGDAMASGSAVVADAYVRGEINARVGPVILGADAGFTHTYERTPVDATATMQAGAATGATDAVEVGIHAGAPF